MRKLKNNVMRKTLTIVITMSLIFSLLPSSMFAQAVENNVIQSTDESVSYLNPTNNQDDLMNFPTATIIGENLSKRGEFEKHFIKSDGTYVAVTYPEAIHYKENGTWNEVNNILSFDAESNKYESQNKDFKASFSKDGGDELISLEKDGYSLSWTVKVIKNTLLNGSEEKSFLKEQTLDKEAVQISLHNGTLRNKISGLKTTEEAFDMSQASSRISYENAFGINQNVTLNYTVYQNKVEEDIILTEKSDFSAFKLELNIENLTAMLNDDNSVSFLNTNKDIVYNISVPYMCDAADDVSYDINVNIQQNGSECIIKYTPNQEWINSEKRVYPVLIDPSITTNEYSSSIGDTYYSIVDSSISHASEQKVYVGIKNGETLRTYIRMDLPSLDNQASVISANLAYTMPTTTTTGRTFELYQSASWFTSTLHLHAYQPPLTAHQSTLAFLSTKDTYVFDITQSMQQYYSQGASSAGYVLKYANESVTNPDYNSFYSCEYTEKTKRPVLEVTYDYSLPAGMTPGTIYSFENDATNKCLDVCGGTDANETNVIQYTSNSTASQKFKLGYIDSTSGYLLKTTIGSCTRVCPGQAKL